MDTTALENCPFCGAAAEIEMYNTAPPVWGIECAGDEPCVTTFHDESKAAVIARWNRRTPAQRTQGDAGGDEETRCAKYDRLAGDQVHLGSYIDGHPFKFPAAPSSGVAPVEPGAQGFHLHEITRKDGESVCKQCGRAYPFAPTPSPAEPKREPHWFSEIDQASQTGDEYEGPLPSPTEPERVDPQSVEEANLGAAIRYLRQHPDTPPGTVLPSAGVEEEARVLCGCDDCTDTDPELWAYCKSAPRITAALSAKDARLGELERAEQIADDLVYSWKLDYDKVFKTLSETRAELQRLREQLAHANAVIACNKDEILDVRQRLQEQIDLSASDIVARDEATRRAEVAEAEASRYENEIAAAIPEDVSVGEYCNAIRAKVEALTAQLEAAKAELDRVKRELSDALPPTKYTLDDAIFAIGKIRGTLAQLEGDTRS